MATFRLYKTSITSGNDISSYVYDLGQFSYRINDDFTFELPELQFSTTQYIPEGTKLFLCDAADVYNKQISFYVQKYVYDVKSQMLNYTCPHILQLLADIKCRDIPAPAVGDSFGDWSNIVPDFDQYNNQTNYALQGQLVWARSYYQAIFLIKMLIHRVAGTSIASIDASALEGKDSHYIGRYADGGSYYNYVFPYDELGLNIPCTLRVGTVTHTDVSATDFWALNELPNCLQLLRHVCAALKVSIDIFRSNYALEIVGVSASADDSDVLGFQEVTLDRYRKFAASAGRLTGGSFDWEFGEWAVGGAYTAYTYGVDSPDREVVPDRAEDEDTAVTTTRSLSTTFMDFFRIYGLSVSNYQSAVYRIFNDETDQTEMDDYVAALKAFWEQYSVKEKIEVEATGLVLRVPYVEYDLAAKIMRYERLI